MLRLRAAMAALVVLAACGGSHPAELHTAAEPPAVVQVDEWRPWPAMTSTTSTTLPPVTTTTAAPAPRPVRAAAASVPVEAPQRPAGACHADPGNDACWDRLAQCESGGNWAINTGNGYYGGLQFALSSWRGVGGTGYPHEHSRAEQIHRGKLLWAQGGWQHWPACTRSFGWR